MSDRLFESADLKAVRRAVSECVRNTGWLTVIGKSGVGKTTAVNHALAAMPDVRVVEPACFDRRRLTIGAVLEATIRDLDPGETVRMGLESRSRQWRRVVGDATANGRVLIVIEEAHALHHETLRALKRLREVGWARQRAPLVGIVLVAQPAILPILRRVREVGLRVTRHSVSGLTEREVGEYLRHAGFRVHAKAVKEFARAHREPLELVNMADAARDWAVQRTHREILVEDVRATYGGELDLGERIRQSGLSLAAIAKRAGASKSAVSAVANGKYAGSPRVAEAVARALEGAEPASRAG